MSSPLANRDFRRLLAGRIITNAGDSLYYIAAMWLVYVLTGSTFYTGIAGFLTLAPSAFQFLFGPLVDRVPLRRLLVGTQLVQALVVLVVPLAYATGRLSVWVVLAVMPVLSLLNQPVYPAQSAALPRIVEQEQLVSANSLFSVAYQGIDAGFNALGGVLVALVGAVALFVFDAATFLAAALLFAGLQVRAARGTPAATAEADAAVADGGADLPDEPTGYRADLREGIDYLRGTLMAKVLVGSVIVNGTFGAAMAVLPAYADLLGGEVAYGLLSAAVGGGIFVGALVAGQFREYPLGRLSVGGFLLGAVLWAAAIALGWLPGTVALFALAMIPVGVTNVLMITMVQTLVPERMLGRISAVMGSASTVVVPIGALLGGIAGDVVGPATVLFVAATGFAFLGAYLASLRSFRTLPRIADVETLDA